VEELREQGLARGGGAAGGERCEGEEGPVLGAKARGSPGPARPSTEQPLGSEGKRHGHGKGYGHGGLREVEGGDRGVKVRKALYLGAGTRLTRARSPINRATAGI